MCIDNPILRITQKVINPPNYIKGGSIKIIVGGVTLKDQIISQWQNNLHTRCCQIEYFSFKRKVGILL